MSEVIEGLDIQPQQIIIDGTVNGGGHAEEIVQRMDTSGVFIGIDQDSSGLVITDTRLEKYQVPYHLIHDNTQHIEKILDDLKIASFDRLLLDLGWSSNQFENPERGFSFMHEGPLDMRLNDTERDMQFTAEEIVNDWSEDSLYDIIKGYGEERFTGRIVRAIVETRDQKRITTTTELASIISSAVPRRFAKKGIHPATQTFQALRIAVNEEMQVLRKILASSMKRLNSKGKLVIISFHSIEDRIVKHFFREQKDLGVANIITKKPITAQEEEILQNPRARSAKLRILEKI